MALHAAVVLATASPALCSAHGAAAHAKESAAADTVPAGVSKEAIDRMLEMQVARGGVPDDALRAKVVDVLRMRALLAREAKTAGLANSPRVQAEIEIATNQILAQAYEERLRRALAPTEADVKARYDTMREATTTGTAKVAWPTFEEARASLAQTIVEERIAQKLVALKDKGKARKP